MGSGEDRHCLKDLHKGILLNLSQVFPLIAMVTDLDHNNKTNIRMVFLLHFEYC